MVLGTISALAVMLSIATSSMGVVPKMKFYNANYAQNYSGLYGYVYGSNFCSRVGSVK